MSFHWYCPYCGEPVCQAPAKCPHCSKYITPAPSKYETTYYGDKSIEKYGNITHWREFLMEEIRENPLFDQKLFEYKKTEEERKKELEDYCRDYVRRHNGVANPNVPRCPTCQSTNVKRISASKKVVHGYLFGIFSQTAFSQYECENCGYKW